MESLFYSLEREGQVGALVKLYFNPLPQESKGE